MLHPWMAEIDFSIIKFENTYTFNIEKKIVEIRTKKLQNHTFVC